uniref:Uncharacterized protein n=1 Tax=Acrobeloides nanus TaxID=290746 RepID=A0A914CWA6_9BILA
MKLICLIIFLTFFILVKSQVYTKFDPSLKDSQKCTQYKAACAQYISCLMASSSCPLPTQPGTSQTWNPCRKYVEPCFGIPESNYVEINQFQGNDFGQNV